MQVWKAKGKDAVERRRDIRGFVAAFLAMGVISLVSATARPSGVILGIVSLVVIVGALLLQRR